MAHEWESANTPGALGFLESPRRRCRNCAKTQTLVTRHWYMRIASKRWEPLVGRCEADRKTPKTARTRRRQSRKS